MSIMFKSIVSLLFIVCCFDIKAQNNTDLVLLENYEYVDKTIAPKRKTSYVFKNSKWYVKYNPVSMVFGSSLFFYQKVISPQIVMGCAFDVSCSNFSKACIKHYGVIKGVALSADRLTRCTRLSSIDFHPVLFNEQGKVNDLPEYYILK